MILIINQNKEIGRLSPYNLDKWDSEIYEWGCCVSTLDRHLRYTKHFFPEAEFVFIP